MFKKILLLAMCISPLLIIEAGYPVKTYSPALQKGIPMTKRCFKVGELREFAKCYATGKTMKGAVLIADMGEKMRSLFPYFDILFLGFIGVSFWTLFHLLSDTT